MARHRIGGPPTIRPLMLFVCAMVCIDTLFYTALTQGADGGILASAHIQPTAFATIRDTLRHGDQPSALARRLGDQPDGRGEVLVDRRGRHHLDAGDAQRGQRNMRRDRGQHVDCRIDRGRRRPRGAQTRGGRS